MKKIIILILIIITIIGISGGLWHLYGKNSIFPTSKEKIRQMILQNKTTENIEKQRNRMNNKKKNSMTFDMYEEISEHKIISDEDIIVLKWLDNYNFKNDTCISNRNTPHSIQFYINNYKKTKDIVFIEKLFKKGYIDSNLKLQGLGACDSLLFTILYSFPDKDFIKTLLENGADINVTNSAGITPKEWVERKISSNKQIINGYKRKEKDEYYYDSKKEYTEMMEIQKILNNY